ncbi:MAG: transposase [Deltaproteobacteria bacterium]|nr:transposase [Deltaproteobacteria bacterium]
MSTGKRYNDEFRLQAAKLVVEQGYNLNEAASRLGVNAWSIRQWIKKFRASGQFPPVSQVIPEAEEMKQLRKENKRLQLEVEILKKAAAYFAKESL